MREIEFRVLGPLEVLADGLPLELNRKKLRSLLALLLLDAGEVVSSDRLIEELWGGKSQKAARHSLQNLVSDLRKVLGRETVRTRQPGYVLDVDRDRIDLHRFERLVALAAEGGDPERRSSLLREALALWRGPPLADLTFEPFAHVEVARLEELRTAAREELAQADLELGHHSRLIPELESLVAEHPLRERLRGQLMVALYRSGRQAEALEAYRAARETLVEELGIDPSPELQELEQAILRHDPSLELPEASPEAPGGEERRKVVTLLFADVVDFTRLGAALDPEVLRNIMRRYFDTVRTVVERHGGSVEKFIGDAAMAVFGIPQLHEDDALRAVRAATDLREALVVVNAELERDHALTLQVRIGINTGEVLAGDAAAGQPFATGAPVNVAMRLQQAALPGETLLGETTLALVHDRVETEPVEPVDVGAPEGPSHASRLLGVGEDPGVRPLSGASFVGRGAELSWLEDAFRAVRDERRSRALFVLGEAGIGKTRLVTEFVSSISDNARSLVGRCVSYGEGATYLPLAEIVREVAPERPQAAIAGLLEGEGDAALIAERMAELTGQTEGTAPTGELFWAVRGLFDALARRRPLVVVLEDLHWAEPTLLDLVEYLAAWRVDSPLLMVSLARPDLLDQRPALGADADVLRLEPLPETDAGTLVAELAGEVAPWAKGRILDIAEGNPLFVEQLLAFVEDVGEEALESVPPTVEALLASRLDRLDPADRVLLERASVAGREFTRGAIVHLTPPEELPGVDGRLRMLARRSLIRAVRAGTGRNDGFRFHHVLIREVTYAAIRKEARGELHERFAAWLERHEEGVEEIVGYHLEQAHAYRAELRPGDPELAGLAQRAGERLGTAGIRAWKRADTPASVNLLGRASSLLPTDDPARAELLCELGVALRWAEDLDRACGAFEDAIAAASAAHDRRVELRARLEEAYAGLLVGGNGSHSEFLDLATQAIPVFEELEDDRALARAWRQVGFVKGGLQSRHAEWEEAAERALVYYRRSGWSASGCLAELAASLYCGPTKVGAGIARCRELLDETTDRVGRAHVLAFLGGLEALGGGLDEGRALATQASEIYDELDERYARAYNSGRMLGRIELLAGDFEASEAILRPCCDVFERAHDHAALSSTLSEVGQAVYAAGRFGEAAEAARVAEQLAPKEDVTAQFAWRALTAKLRARDGALEEAESLALEAVALSESTDSPCQRGDVLLDLAEVQRLGERSGDAAGSIERALALFEQKGDAVSAERARGSIGRLTAQA